MWKTANKLVGAVQAETGLTDCNEYWRLTTVFAETIGIRKGHAFAIEAVRRPEHSQGFCFTTAHFSSANQPINQSSIHPSIQNNQASDHSRNRRRDRPFSAHPSVQTRSQMVKTFSKQSASQPARRRLALTPPREAESLFLISALAPHPEIRRKCLTRCRFGVDRQPVLASETGPGVR